MDKDLLLSIGIFGVVILLLFGCYSLIRYHILWNHELATGQLSPDAKKIIVSIYVGRGWTYVFDFSDGSEYIYHTNGLVVYSNGYVKLNRYEIESITTRYDRYHIAKAFKNNWYKIRDMNIHDMSVQNMSERKKRIENEKEVLSKL